MRAVKIFFISIILAFSCSLFAVINYSGNDYNEKMLPVSGSGTVAEYYVVMGTSLSITSNTTSSRNTTTFTINGTNYRGVTGSVTASADDRYYIYHKGKKVESGFTISGTNDWTTQTHTSITLPYTQTGTTSAFYETSTSARVDSIVSSGLDLLLINNSDYTNQTVTTLPAKQDNKYYIYYGSPASGSPSLKVTPYTPQLNLKLFLEGGIW
ncbi:MAG: hypothetical protein U9O95_02175 [Candidatus Marinimicrobia bacterium]|nr:hypothetical protein [Candidatus Neomarinimicrobiota bacterium]